MTKLCFNALHETRALKCSKRWRQSQFSRLAWSLIFAITCAFFKNTASAALLDLPFPLIYQTSESIFANPECDSVVTSHEMTLEDLSVSALCKNPDARIALAQITRQNAALEQSLSSYYPKIEASGYAGKLRKDVNYDAVNIQQRTRANTNNIEANLTWLLYDFGARESNLGASRALIRAATASRAASLQSILFETAKRYYELEAELARFHSYKDAESVASESLTMADAQHAAGVGMLSNRLLLANSKGRTVVARTQSQGAVDNARSALLSYAGIQPFEKINVLYPRAEIATTDELEPSNFKDMIVEAINRNPQVESARAQLEAAERNIAFATAEGLPTVSLALSSGRSNALPSDQIAQKTATLSAVIQVRIPIFDGFSQRSKVEAARADLYTRQAELDKVDRDVSLEAWQALSGWQNGVAQVKAAQSLITTTRRSGEVAQGRLKAGVGDIFEVLRSQDDVSNANLMLIDALKMVRISRIQLGQALGNLTPAR